MVGYTNYDLYTMMNDRIRKDQRGLITIEEMESFLRWRSLDMFSKYIAEEGKDKDTHEALSPFYLHHEDVDIQSYKSTYYVWIKALPSGVTTTSTTTLEAGIYLSYDPALLVNVWYSASSEDFSSLTHVDLINSSELSDRLNNAITRPTLTNPVGYVDEDRLWIFGPTSGYILLDYYRYPTPEYLDYYTDGDANIVYVPEGTSPKLYNGYTARDGTTGDPAGVVYASSSVETEWGDDDAMHILDMIVSDVSIALSDPDSFQASLLERKDNA